jgi:hypothetical protein
MVERVRELEGLPDSEIEVVQEPAPGSAHKPGENR